MNFKGLGPQIVADAGITFEDVDGAPAWVIPYRHRDGSTQRLRIFYEGGKRIWGYGDEVVLYGLERLAGYARVEPLLLCEGESDALSAIEHGWQALGVPGALIWKSEWTPTLHGFEVVVVGDGDDTGEKFPQKVRVDIPHAAVVAMAPGDDIRSMLQSGRAEEFRRLVDDARRKTRLAAAVLGATDIKQAERWLAGEEPMPFETFAAALAGPVEFDESNTPAPYTTYVVGCDHCGQEMPHHFERGAYLCLGCEAT